MQIPAGFRVVSERTPFQEAVATVVRSIPAGRVATYSAVAEAAGRPGAARAAGSALAQGLDVPWHRVVTAQGRLVPGHEPEHAELLRSEGVMVARGHIRAPVPWWDPSRRLPATGGPGA